MDSRYGVLAIDGDSTRLRELGKRLLKCNYNVATCTRMFDAIGKLGQNIYPFRIHIVICDFAMPEDGQSFQFVYFIARAFAVPVILVSEKEDKVGEIKALGQGARAILYRPLETEQLAYIWQFAVREQVEIRANKKRSRPIILMMGNELKNPNNNNNANNNMEASTSTSTEQNKKARVSWTEELHQKFLDALERIGDPTVGPRKILEVMNVEGVTRSQVASHLQKYRQKMEEGVAAAAANEIRMGNNNNNADESHPSEFEPESQAQDQDRDQATQQQGCPPAKPSEEPQLQEEAQEEQDQQQGGFESQFQAHEEQDQQQQGPFESLLQAQEDQDQQQQGRWESLLPAQEDQDQQQQGRWESLLQAQEEQDQQQEGFFDTQLRAHYRDRQQEFVESILQVPDLDQQQAEGFFESQSQLHDQDDQQNNLPLPGSNGIQAPFSSHYTEQDDLDLSEEIRSLLYPQTQPPMYFSSRSSDDNCILNQKRIGDLGR